MNKQKGGGGALRIRVNVEWGSHSIAISTEPLKGCATLHDKTQPPVTAECRAELNSNGIKEGNVINH